MDSFIQFLLMSSVTVMIISGVFTVYNYMENGKASAHSSSDIDTGIKAILGAIVFIVSAASVGLFSWLA